MIHNAADDEMKQAQFIAKLEILGIFDLLRKWGESNIEEITGQIEVLLIYLNKMSENLDYQLEVYKNRTFELELHSKVLERKVEYYREQQAMFKVMMNDLENYKLKADMSKELATFFSPFAPIKQFSQEELFK